MSLGERWYQNFDGTEDDEKQTKKTKPNRNRSGEHEEIHQHADNQIDDRWKNKQAEIAGNTDQEREFEFVETSKRREILEDDVQKNKE